MDQWFSVKTIEKETAAIIIKKQNIDLQNIHFTADDLSKWLNQKNIVYGVMNEVIAQIIQDIESVEFPVIIAKGKQPVDGTPAELVPAIGLELSVKYDDQDKIDFKRLFTIPAVATGQLIARKKPATEGEAGISVLRKLIPARPGKDLMIKNGENTVFNSEDQGIYATADGEVSFQSNAVHVYPVYRVNGDLSLKTGHIDFVGNVHVTGNVPSGFKIHAKGDIRIEGLVEAAEIKTPGSVVIAGGVLGQGKGLIQCGGNFTSLYINQGNILAGGNIEVVQSILYSQCEAESNIICMSGKGNITGGTIKASHKISANEIGNETYAKTLIYMGLHELDQTLLMEIDHKMIELQKNIQKLEQLKEAMAKQAANAGTSNRSTIERIDITLNQTRAQYSQLNLEKNNLLNPEQNKTSHISVRGTLYPNVEIGIGKYRRKVQSTYHSAKVFMKDKEIVIHSL